MRFVVTQLLTVSYECLRAIVALALFSAVLFAQSSLEKAVSLTRERHYAEARQILVGVPEPAEVTQRIAFHRLKAAIASGLGEPALAVREMHSALALSPNDAKLLLATAIAEMQAGLLDDALHHAQSAGSSPTARAIVGDIEDQRGDYAAAAAAYQAAVSLAPDQEPYRVALALELIQHQSFAAAIKLLKESAPLFPHSAKLRTLLGIASYASGFGDDAISAFESAIAVDPHFDAAYSCLAQVLLESSAPPRQQDVNLLCGWNAIACSAVRLRVAREHDDATTIRHSIAILERAPPDNALARCELARGYEWSNQLTAARVQMEACVRLDPTPQNHYRMGMLYQKLGLSSLAHQEMELRNQLQAKMSQQTAVGMNALASFKLAIK
ncbi:MAG TPA: tetratricopeptide repeat protein [Bryobacteraceae bacterium]|jgi:tetratricopeptide (TPR) repeat protein|nr:tetratricopeptide repeat protein [Bryobacteraceae bacterium]